MGLVDNFVRLDLSEVSDSELATLKDRLTFYPNPDRKTWSYRVIPSKKEVWLPRGAMSIVPEHVNLRDRRSFPKLPKLETSIVLDYKDEIKEFKGQQDCINSMFEKQQGLICRQPGSGKTNIALYFIAKAGTRTLVIVHTVDILNQWIDYATERIPGIEIGIIKAGKESIGQLTIGTVQSIIRRNYPPEWWRQFGVTILDECHHVAAKTFDVTLAHATSRYRFGLSASKTRADNMQELMHHTFGPFIHEMEFESPVKVTVEKVRTNFSGNVKMTGPMWLKRKKWQGLIKQLTTDPARNKLIAKRVGKRLDEGRSTLVLSRRIEHLQLIKNELAEEGHESIILAAKLLSKRERKRIVDEFREGNIKCVLATQLADEALDIPILSCIALTFPGKHSDLILQQVGRALREYPHKDSAIIIDVVDEKSKTLRTQWYSRRKAYKKWGFKITSDGISGRVVMPSKLRRKPKPIMGQLRMF